METDGVVADGNEILHCFGVGQVEVGCCGKGIDGTWKGIGGVWRQDMSVMGAEEVGWSTEHSQLGSEAC